MPLSNNLLVISWQSVILLENFFAKFDMKIFSVSWFVVLFINTLQFNFKWKLCWTWQCRKWNSQLRRIYFVQPCPKLQAKITVFMVRCTRYNIIDKVCQWLATGRWFSPGTPVFSTNKTDCHASKCYTYKNQNNSWWPECVGSFTWVGRTLVNLLELFPKYFMFNLPESVNHKTNNCSVVKLYEQLGDGASDIGNFTHALEYYHKMVSLSIQLLHAINAYHH
jgi:hypothetical protein